MRRTPRIAAAIALSLVTAAGAAVAQPSPPRQVPPPPPPVKSLRTGGILTVGATAVAVGGLILVTEYTNSDEGEIACGLAVIAAPSAGHWYAGRWLTPGLGVRVAGAIAMAGGALYTFEATEEDFGDEPVGVSLFLAGSAVFIAGAVWDAATLRHTVQRANRRALRDYTLVPVVGPHQSGVAFAGRF